MAFMQDLWNKFVGKVIESTPKIITVVIILVIGYIIIKIIKLCQKVDVEPGEQFMG